MTSQPPVKQRPQLARETRKRFVTEVGRAMVELGSAVQQRLTELMDEVAPSRVMQSRRDAWTIYRRLQQPWVEATLNDWHTALKPVSDVAKKVQKDVFELVGTEVMEDKIIASRLMLGVVGKVSVELEDLNLRMKYLEDVQDLPARDILRPEVLLLLLVERWSSVGLPRDAWSMVNEVAQTLMTDRLRKAYANCNTFLVEQGVLPVINLKDRIKRMTTATGHSPTGLQGGEAARAREGSDKDSGWGDIRQQAPVRYSSARQSLDYEGATADEGGAMVSTNSMARARHRALGVMGQLRNLLIGASGPDFEVTVHHPPSTALATAMAMMPAPVRFTSSSGTVMEDYSPAGVARVADDLRRRSTDLKGKAETKSEKATIEIVALMFQAILQESRIPAGIRVWFARLQMPVLREALAAPDFFGTLNHPARLLIDRMGSCVMGFDATSINGTALEGEIKRVVQVIEQYPETGQRVYQLVYDEFQKFLSRFLTDKTSTQKVVSVAQQVELKETLAIQYTIEMRDMLKDMPVRDEIRQFLFKVWAEVLALAAIRKGPQHVETLELKKSATDLLWAASAKPNRADRSRVIQELPMLLQKLRAGMTSLAVPAAEQEIHINVVRETLADAFLSKTQTISREQIERMAERLAHLEDFVTDDGQRDLPLDAQSIRLMLGSDASNIDVVADGGTKPTAAMLAWARELHLGAWFTLDHNGQVAQVQFVWRSERKHLNLFASTDGRSYLMQAGRLAAYLQSGLLLPHEDEALTVRATRDALVKLQANPERLLG